jgi:hypothetical protein
MHWPKSRALCAVVVPFPPAANAIPLSLLVLISESMLEADHVVPHVAAHIREAPAPPLPKLTIRLLSSGCGAATTPLARSRWVRPR